MNFMLYLIPTIISYQCKTPSGYGCRNYFFVIFFKLYNLSSFTIQMRQPIMPESNLIFKSETYTINSYNTSGYSYFCQINNVTYPIIRRSSHNSLTIYNIVNYAIKKHTLRYCKFTVIICIIVNCQSCQIKVNIITP